MPTNWELSKVKWDMNVGLLESLISMITDTLWNTWLLETKIPTGSDENIYSLH